jgi:hypothetical protein
MATNLPTPTYGRAEHHPTKNTRHVPQARMRQRTRVMETFHTHQKGHGYTPGVKMCISVGHLYEMVWSW